VDGADVELGLQGQGEGAPVGVPGQAGQGDPDVAVDVPLAGGPGAGVVVDAGALDEGAVASRRGVVDGQQQALGVQQGPGHALDRDGHVVGLPADGADGGVGVAVVAADAGGP